jgi:hypothetical protein
MNPYARALQQVTQRLHCRSRRAVDEFAQTAKPPTRLMPAIRNRRQGFTILSDRLQTFDSPIRGPNRHSRAIATVLSPAVLNPRAPLHDSSLHRARTRRPPMGARTRNAREHTHKWARTYVRTLILHPQPLHARRLEQARVSHRNLDHEGSDRARQHICVRTCNTLGPRARARGRSAPKCLAGRAVARTPVPRPSLRATAVRLHTRAAIVSSRS